MMRVFTESEIDRLVCRPFWPAATSRDCGEAYMEILRGWQDLMARAASELEYHGRLRCQEDEWEMRKERSEQMCLEAERT